MESREYLKKAINIKKMKAREFADYIGVTESAISKILKGKRSMDVYTCFQVSEIAKIKAEYLISLSTAEREKNKEKKQYLQEKVKELGFIQSKILKQIIFFLSSAIIIFYITRNTPKIISNKIIENLNTTSIETIRNIIDYILC